MSELKPCPFCGGKGVENFKTHSLAYRVRGWTAEIRCDDCYATIDENKSLVGIRIGETIEDSDKRIIRMSMDAFKDCVAKWNTRINIPKSPETNDE